MNTRFSFWDETTGNSPRHLPANAIFLKIAASMFAKRATMQLKKTTKLQR
jgi:hypothetical protein